MPTEPAQIAIVLFEICLLLSGAGLALWVGFNSGARARWLGTNALPAAPASLFNFVLATVLIFLTGFAFQATAQLWVGPLIASAADHQGLALFVYSLANYGGALVAWKVMFPSLRRSWMVEAEMPAAPQLRPLPWAQAGRAAVGTLLIALPVLSILSLGWTHVVEQLGLPVVPQDVIAIFASTRSPLVIGAMLLVACVLAPIYEELLFRAGLYRFCRQKLGRNAALLISGAAFGALHGNWAGFVPLAVLGMGLAIAYEATGSIRVPIIAHGLFNLNTVLVLLSGLPQLAK
ncbi:MAG TPA: type II CAAX endopeptidase family protein [Lacunisphaera sp.]|nr:type II CAAX endopeptidase family protein [Lacunisphaera sp.]